MIHETVWVPSSYTQRNGSPQRNSQRRIKWQAVVRLLIATLQLANSNSNFGVRAMVPVLPAAVMISGWYSHQPIEINWPGLRNPNYKGLIMIMKSDQRSLGYQKVSIRYMSNTPRHWLIGQGRTTGDTDRGYSKWRDITYLKEKENRRYITKSMLRPQLPEQCRLQPEWAMKPTLLQYARPLRRLDERNGHLDWCHIQQAAQIGPPTSCSERPPLPWIPK